MLSLTIPDELKIQLNAVTSKKQISPTGLLKNNAEQQTAQEASNLHQESEI